jgi:hypothetical protein
VSENFTKFAPEGKKSTEKRIDTGVERKLLTFWLFVSMSYLEDLLMLLAPQIRLWLFFGGLTAIMLSFILDGTFATDVAVPVPEPNILALMGVGGAVAVLLSLFRGPRK